MKLSTSSTGTPENARPPFGSEMVSTRVIVSTWWASTIRRSKAGRAT